MSGYLQARNAYQAASSHRTLRQQEADVFRRANGALRAARNGSTIDRVRALADNRRLWLLIADLVLDPDNALPEPTRAGLANVARSVQREMRQREPDFDFLIDVNENIAAGLGGG